MRGASRLLAAVKGARYLEPGTPTGLTGLFTHPSPRSSLIYLYVTTLDKLKALPTDSVYRKSVEALTEHRLQIVRSVKPAGWDEWAAKVAQVVEEKPEAFATPGEQRLTDSKLIKEVRDGKVFITEMMDPELDERTTSYDRESLQEKSAKEARRLLFGEAEQLRLEKEPALTADQVVEIENQIGAGLIEEVIQVAEGELKLVEVMEKGKVWEDLEEKPVEGQWTYFARGSHMPVTQTSPEN